MSAEETTLEEKIFSIAVLLSCVGLGYLTRSQDIISMMLRDFIGFPLPYYILDSLIQIITVGSLCMVLIGMILLQFDKKEDKEIVKIICSECGLEFTPQDVKNQTDTVRECPQCGEILNKHYEPSILTGVDDYGQKESE